MCGFMVANVGVTLPKDSGMGLMELMLSWGNCLGASHKNSGAAATAAAAAGLILSVLVAVVVEMVGSLFTAFCLSLLEADIALIADDEWEDICLFVSQ